MVNLYSDLSNKNGQKIGHIKKLYSGLLREMLTKADNYCLTFPK